MNCGDSLESMRDEVRRNHLRLAILALVTQGGPTDFIDLRRELPTHPTSTAIEYHLLVLRCAGLLRLPARGQEEPRADLRDAI